MLGSSHNTPFNFFVWDLGRVKGDETFIEAAYNFSSILNDLGFPETKLVNFLSKKVPGESREGNKSTPNEINRAMHTIYTGNSEVFKKSREALKNAPKENRFSHSNRVLNKIGLNSRGLMDTTIVEIDGKEYIITAIDILGENFDGVPGNDINVESYYNNGNNSISKITQDLIDARKSVS